MKGEALDEKAVCRDRLGRFGGSVARALCEMGYEVLVVDKNEQRIQDFSNIATHAVVADTTDEEA